MKYFNWLLIFLLVSAVASCYNSPVITGSIFDYDTGKPVKGAIVKFYSSCANPNCKDKYGSSITDDKGRYKIVIKNEVKILDDKFYIEVQKDGYITLYDNFSMAKDNKLSIYLKEISS